MTSQQDITLLSSRCKSFDDLAAEITTHPIWHASNISDSDRWIASLSALASKGYVSEFVHQAGRAVNAGMDPIQFREVAIHVSMYAGFPGSSRLVRALADAGLLLNALDDTPVVRPHNADRMSVGADVKISLHKERSETDYASKASPAADLYTVATEYLYGDLWVRAGLSIRDRMVCSIASFTALSLVSQQRKFFQSAANIGISKKEVIGVIGATAPYSGFAPALAAIAVADEVIA